MVDFNKHLGTKKRRQKPLRPADIYGMLDLASDKGPLRPAQEAVLEVLSSCAEEDAIRPVSELS